MILYIILYFLYTLNVALIEAILWHLQAYQILPKINKHIFLIINRTFPLITLALFNWDLTFILGIYLLSEGIRPSMYYKLRNILNPKVYINGIWAEPYDELGKKSSIFNLKLYQRAILTILGTITLIIF